MRQDMRAMDFYGIKEDCVYQLQSFQMELSELIIQGF